MKNLITLCSYYVQLSTMLCELLHTIVDNVMCLFFDCPKLCQFITASITSKFLGILTSSTKYQGLDGYFCDNAVYPEISVIPLNVKNCAS